MFPSRALLPLIASASQERSPCMQRAAVYRELKRGIRSMAAVALQTIFRGWRVRRALFGFAGNALLIH